jgi:hypothetical protein
VGVLPFLGVIIFESLDFGLVPLLQILEVVLVVLLLLRDLLLVLRVDPL